MYKKATICLASVALILTGCGGVKDEFVKGDSLYKKGDYESLIDARKFFNEYAEKNPGDNDVNEYFTKIDKALIVEAKAMTNKAYENKKIEKAMEYVTVALEADPTDKEIKKAYDLVKAAYDDQIIYNKFTDYLEASYVEAKDITDKWDKAIKMIETGNANYTYATVVAKSLYPDVVELRKSINAESLKGGTVDSFKKTNNDLFNYVVAVERELSSIMTKQDAIDIMDYKEIASFITPEKFNETFILLQESTSTYVNELNYDGKPLRNIEDTLNFTDAYVKIKEEELKKLQEQQAQLNNPAPTTP